MTKIENVKKTFLHRWSKLLTRKDGGPECDVLVHADGVVERNVEMKESVSKERDEVATHRHEQRGVGEHHRTGRTTSYCHAVTADATKTRLFTLYRENWPQNTHSDFSTPFGGSSVSNIQKVGAILGPT